MRDTADMGSTSVWSDDPGHVPRGIAKSWCDYLARARAINPDPNPQYDASMPTSIKTTNKEKGGRTAVSTSRVPVLPYDTR